MFRFVILSTILFVFGVNGAPQALQQGGAEITASAYSNGQSSATAGGNPPIPIISQVESNGLDGSYNYSYETGNGIKQESSGFLKKAVVPKLRDDGTETGETQEEQVLVQIGSYSYTGPDGVVYTLKYVADENGFQPVADYLPTPPAIPEQILSSLKQQSNEAAAGGGFQAAQGGSYNARSSFDADVKSTFTKEAPDTLASAKLTEDSSNTNQIELQPVVVADEAISKDVSTA